MPDHQRLEFVTRHFLDLQSIRFAPLPAAMLLTPIAAPLMPHVSRGVAWGMLSGFVLLLAGFYYGSTFAIRKRYGSVKLSRQEALRMRGNPIIFTLYAVMVLVLTWFQFFAPNTHHSGDVYISFTALIAMLHTILDSTNPPNRRIAWTIGLVVLFVAGALMLRVNGAAVTLAGAVWLSLSVFDFLLLRRTFTEVQRG